MNKIIDEWEALGMIVVIGVIWWSIRHCEKTAKRLDREAEEQYQSMK